MDSERRMAVLRIQRLISVLALASAVFAMDCSRRGSAPTTPRATDALELPEIARVVHPIDAGNYRYRIPGSAEAYFGGPLKGEIVRRVLKLHLPEIRPCYETELSRMPGLHGHMKARFTIGPKGQVETAAVRSSDMDSPPLEACLGACRGNGLATEGGPWRDWLVAGPRGHVNSLG